MAKTLAATQTAATTRPPRSKKGTGDDPADTVRNADSETEDGDEDTDEDADEDTDSDEDFGDGDEDFDDDFDDDDGADEDSDDFDDEDDDFGDDDEEELAARGSSPTPKPAAEAKPEPVKRGPGRPRKDGSPPRSRVGAVPEVGKVAQPEAKTGIAGRNLLPIPKPTGMKSRYKMSEKDLLKYWWSIPGDARQGRIKAVVYRDWPVIDRAAVGKRKYIGEMWDPPVDSDGVRELFGSGDYTLWLNDMSTNENLCKGTIQTKRDMREWPPVIEIEDLVLDDPQNQSYVRGLRMQGILPREGEQEMIQDKAGSEAVSVLGRLAEKAVSGRDRAEREPGNITEEAYRNSVDMIVGGHKTAMELALQQAKQEMKSGDPVEAAKNLIDVAKSLAPSGGGAGNIAEVLAVIVPLIKRDDGGAALKEVTDAYQGLVREMIGALKGRENPEKPSPTLTQQIKDLLAMKELLGELQGGEGKGDGKPWWADFVPVGLSMFNQAIQLGAQVLQVKGGQGEVAAVQAGPLGGVQPNPAQVAGSAKGAQPGQPAAQGQQGAGGGGMDPNVANFLAEIRRPLIRFLRDPDSDGVEFAEYFIQAYSEADYRQILGRGKGMIEMVLKMDPEIRTALESDPEGAAQFIHEFFDRDRILAEEAGEGETEGEDGEQAEALEPVPVKVNGAAKPGKAAAGAPPPKSGKVTRGPSGVVDRT